MCHILERITFYLLWQPIDIYDLFLKMQGPFSTWIFFYNHILA